MTRRRKPVDVVIERVHKGELGLAGAMLEYKHLSGWRYYLPEYVLAFGMMAILSVIMILSFLNMLKGS